VPAVRDDYRDIEGKTYQRYTCGEAQMPVAGYAENYQRKRAYVDRWPPMPNKR
jgi:hypothetical protein